MTGGIVGEYKALKREADADVLAMQVGDFYEFFDQDAELVADELDLKLSKKGSAGDKFPMAGVPLTELTPYLKQLVERGYRVAVADQREVGDGHEREVIRVVTPGTLLETTDAEAQYLAAVVRDGADESSTPATFGLAFVDVTTGRFLVTTVEGRDAAFTELYRFDPAEVLPGPDLRADDGWMDALGERIDASVTDHESDAFAPGAAAHAAREQFGEGALSSVGLDREGPALRAVGAALSYVERTGSGVLDSLTRLQTYRADDHVALDATTQRNLELTETMTGRGGSLFDTVDHTVTSAGARRLREWLQRPRRAPGELRRRQDGVAAFAAGALARERVREILDDAYDLERLAGKATHGSAAPRHLLQVRDTLALLPDLADAVDSAPELAESPVASILDRPDRSRLADLGATVDEALVEDPPSNPSDCGLFRRGFDDDLDELIDRHEEHLEWLDGLADREKRAHGITHLQVDRNRTDGYYVQVGNSETGEVPEHYREIKSLKNSKRYTTDELEAVERDVLRVEERRGDLEAALFEELRDRVAGAAEALQDAGRALAEVDVLASLATHAVANDWTRPDLTTEDVLEVEAGRHPVVEQTVEFVPNDARFDPERRVLLVTGPNMSGKSTYMRQVALIVLLAQVGSFVPADAARIGLVDGIYTRVGALDELAQGRSTFMVEMQELSNILHSASEDSLVILDEVGRGTATFDGISIAWAATEYIHNQVGAKALFATHYHELTSLAEHLDRVANVHVAAAERDGEVTFLHAIQDGPTDRSYGVHVADLAGVPDPVVDRAADVLDRLRQEKAIEARGGSSGTKQAVFDLSSGQFRTGGGENASGDPGADDRSAADGGTAGSDPPLDPATRAVLDDLRETDVNQTPPVELLGRVQEWQARLNDGDGDVLDGETTGSAASDAAGGDDR